MGRILITGSADGIGALAAQQLIARGHSVHLHARSPARARDALKQNPGAASCLVADLSCIAGALQLAQCVRQLGQLDCIIHNAGVLFPRGKESADGWGLVFATNTVAPYLLTTRIAGAAKRYIFITSSVAARGEALGDLEDCNYMDSKLHNIIFAYAFARRFEGVVDECHACDPGWVKTKMGGDRAPGDIHKSVAMYVKLAEGVGGPAQYWGPDSERRPGPVDSQNAAVQDQLLETLERICAAKCASARL